jgi:hypothetical protein
MEHQPTSSPHPPRWRAPPRWSGSGSGSGTPTGTFIEPHRTARKESNRKTPPGALSKTPPRTRTPGRNRAAGEGTRRTVKRGQQQAGTHPPDRRATRGGERKPNPRRTGWVGYLGRSWPAADRRRRAGEEVGLGFVARAGGGGRRWGYLGRARAA